MTSLPVLPSAPERSPVDLGELAVELREELSPADWTLARALLLRLDLANLEALVSGRDDLFDDRALYTREQLSPRGDADLPPFLEDFLLAQEEGGGGDYAFHELYRAYYAEFARLADEGGSAFLAEWAAWELPLLNALARWRGEELKVETDSARLEEPNGPAAHEELLSRVAEEADPQARERLIDSARLTAIEARSGTDPFSVDAVLAYLAAAMVLDRWDLPREADAAELLEVFE